MSLLDDVSIVVTPNAYKASKLYAVLPTAVEGSELITNGDFSGGNTGWSVGAGWSIGSGKASVDNASSTPLTQSGLAVIIGKKYNVSFEVSDYVSGGFQFQFGGSQVVAAVSANGVYNFSAISTVNTTVLYLYGTGDCEFKVDNLTCKQDTGADMSVTRATAATRVDENGLVNYAEVLGSELVTNGNFDSNITGWSAKSSTIAWDNGKLKADNSSGNQYGGAYQNIGLVTGKQYKMTLTMQLLTGSSNGTFMLFTSSSSGGSQSLVHTGGALVVGGAAVTETFYFTPASGDVSIQPSCDEANATFTIDNVSVKEVTRNNVPRIDYTGGGCPHILAEPQRTNLIPYSNGFSYSSYTRNGTTATTGFLSPDGTLNAYKLLEDNTNAIHRIYQTATVTGSPNTTISIYVKYLGRKYVLMRIADSNVGRWYDIENGVLGGTYLGTPNDSSIESAGNGWYRISITHTVSNQSRLELWVSDTESVSAYQGDTSKGVYLFGAQLEVGTYPTSYIPTSGSSVTRNTDQFSRDGISSLINSTAGVFFIEMAALLDEGTTADKWIALSDGTANNSVRIAYSGGANTIRAYINVGGSAQADMTYAVTNVTQFSKIAFSYAANNFNLWVDGVKRATDTSGNVFSANTLNRVGLDNGGGGSFPGKIKQLQVYKTALTDTQLTSLTS